MERELNVDAIMDGFQVIEAALKRIASALGVSMEEYKKTIELSAWVGDAELSSEQKRAVYMRGKRMKERMAYLQSLDQRKKSQVIKRKIRYQKKLP